MQDVSVPCKFKIDTRQPLWFTNRLRNTLKKQKSLYNAWKKDSSEYNKARYITVRKYNKKLVKQSKRSYLCKRLYKPLLTGDSKPFYRYIKQNRENGCDIIPDLKYNGNIATSSVEKANMLNKFFESVFISDSGNSSPTDFPHLPVDTSNLDITKDGVHKLLKDIKISKSCGPDNLPGVLLKTFASVIASSLTKIFSYSFNSCSLPDVWKLAKVRPIFKKGDRSQPTNYRPVSLTCITCKLMEHIVSSEIHSFLDENNVLHGAQHGFRKGRSCETQLIHTFNTLAMNKEKGHITDVIILDFSKAFDSVSHKKLIFKLQRAGLNPKIISWIEAFLSNRQQFVFLDGSRSSPCLVHSGVPQGSVLGPLLFLLFVDDLPGSVTSECRLFADDALIFNTRGNSLILQNDLKTLENWSHTWQMSFNTSKCCVLSIGEKDSTHSYFLNNNRLKNVNSHPYLGVEISHNLKWDDHIEKVTTKANKVRGMLGRVLKFADTKTRLVAYKTLVRSNLEYACQVWDPYKKVNSKKLEKVQNKALRFIYRIRSRVSFSKLREDTNIQSLKTRRKEQRLKLFCKVTETGVIDNKFSPPGHTHNTRQQTGMFIPSIKTSAYFNSFWPRTTRELRGDASDSG